MNISEESILPRTDDLRSPFSVNAPEIVFAIAIALATIIGLWSFLHSALPYPCSETTNNIPIDCGWTEQEAWQQLGLPLFSKYIIPFVLLNMLAAVFVVRVIRKDTRGFSLLGRLALAWPMFSLLAIHILGPFSCYCVPAGLILGVIATFMSDREQRNKLDWISLPINLLSIITCGLYLSELLGRYGD